MGMGWREVERQGMLWVATSEANSACLPAPSDPVYIVHEQRHMLAQRLLAIAAGYEDLNDHDTIRRCRRRSARCLNRI